MKKLRVFIADDQQVVREGIKMLINAQPDMEIIGEAGDGGEARRLCKDLMPDIVIMDVSLPDLNGAQVTEHLRVDSPQSKVLALSASQDEAHIEQLLNSGATGYVLKKAIAEELIIAIRTVSRGGIHIDPEIADKVVNGLPLSQHNHASLHNHGNESLSNREQEVLRLIAWGHTNKEIATLLQLSVKTVESHKTRLMEKLGFAARTDIVRYALRRGWLKEDS